MKKIITPIAILLFSFFISVAQGPHFDWARSIGGNGFNNGMSIAVDQAGSVYSTGFFESTVDFDPGAGTDSMISNGLLDFFIQKLDSSGNYRWAKTFGGLGVDYGLSIYLDKNNNVFVTGFFIGTVDFDPGPGIYNLSAPDQEGFVLKLDSAGNFLWVKSIEGNEYGIINWIAIDAIGNIYLTGAFSDTVDFDPGISTYFLVESGQFGQDIFILKLDSSGNFIWAKSIGGPQNEWGSSVAISASGNVYVTGWFKDTVDFNPDTAVYDLSSTGTYNDSYILKLDSSGNFIWARAFGGTDATSSYSISVDPLENIIVAGEFDGTVDFDPDMGVYNVTSLGLNDIFNLKIDFSGDFVWAKVIGGTNNDQGYSISMDPSGGVLTTGYFYDTVDFDPGAGAFMLGSAGKNLCYILKLDKAGNFVWAKELNVTGYTNGSSVFNKSGDVYVTGNFSGTADFDPDTGLYTLTSNFSSDIFAWKLKCTNTEIDLIETACGSFVSPSGFYTWEVSGTYTDIIPNFIGCDSIITIHLTIEASTSVTVNGGTLTSGATAGTYQWLDCANGNTPVAGATNQSFTPQSNGSYAVAVNENGCQDTSLCYTITGVGMEEISKPVSFYLYPNPCEEEATCRFQLHSTTPVGMSLFDLTGRKLWSKDKIKMAPGQYEEKLSVKSFLPGIYFLYVEHNDNLWITKIVKQ